MTPQSPPGTADQAAPGAAARGAQQSVRLLVVTASARARSLNAWLARAASREAAEWGATVESLGLPRLVARGFDQEVQDDTGIPSGPALLRARLSATDALLLVSPEYNASVPGSLKNVIDWTSRFRPQPFHGLPALLMSASPSLGGGRQGLAALRIPLEHLGARVWPAMFALAEAQHAFTADGMLREPSLDRLLGVTVREFLTDVGGRGAGDTRSRQDSTWVEFLGERPSPQTSRSDGGALGGTHGNPPWTAR